MALSHSSVARKLLDLGDLSHGHPFVPVVAALEQKNARWRRLANPTEKDMIPSRRSAGVRPECSALVFGHTGTEAVMFAIKAAQAWTVRRHPCQGRGFYYGNGFPISASLTI